MTVEEVADGVAKVSIGTEDAATEDSGVVPEPSLEEAVKIKEDGNALFKAKDWDGAMLRYQDALLVCPEDESSERAKLLSNIGACYLEKESWEDVVKVCTEALEYDPSFLRPRIRRAKANMRLENSAALSSALEDWQEVAKVDPSNSEAQKAIRKLPAEIQTRQEREKEEALGQLKNLGNQFLGMFGLSLDNFKMQPKEDGGYNYENLSTDRMDFDFPSRKGETTAQKAKRERLEREAKRKAEELSVKRVESCGRIQIWYRASKRRIAGRKLVLEEWDAWTGFSLNLFEGGTPTTIGDVVKVIGVFNRLYAVDGKGNSERLASANTLSSLASSFDGQRCNAASRSFSKFLWICLNRSCAGQSAADLYLTGPELRFVITVWDVAKWVPSPKARSVALEARRAVVDRGAHRVIGLAMRERVYTVLKIRMKKNRDAQDEKRAKNCLLWITAMLHISLVALEKPANVNDLSSPYLIPFLSEVLTTPFLTHVLDKSGLDHLVKNLNLVAVALRVKDDPRLLQQLLQRINGELALCFVANAIGMFRVLSSGSSAVPKADAMIVVWLMTLVLEEENMYYGPSMGIPNELYPILTDQFNFLRSKQFIQTVFAELLESDIPDTGDALLDNKNGLFSLLTPQKTHASKYTTPPALERNCAQVSKFFLNLCRTFQTTRLHILNALGWTPNLAAKLWKAICGNHSAYLVDKGDNPLLDNLQLFCDISSVLFLTIDDEDLYEKQKPLSMSDISSICVFLNNFCFMVFRSRPLQTGGPGDKLLTPDQQQRLGIAETSKKLLSLLYDKNERRPFASDGLNWIKKEAQKTSFYKDLMAGKHEAVKVLEDGFAQLRQLPVARLKSIIRVRFVNQFGMAEAGIDQNGVFKEFLEDLCKSAFATNFSLFRTTPDGNCVPSVTSGVHEEHLHLFDFIGKMLAKALLEGIVIDIPFATFVYAKMLGKIAALEDLPSLDEQLYKNLLFLKHYEGNVEDLGLTFTVDSDVFGDVRSREIKPGGTNIAVTNDNRFEYIHLVADFKRM
ncbi:Ubiquitin-protein ligase E3B [Phlyctochytrium bullatum]|nr:Ubiquitin-protein ligase E3B [Phlyctochytrium bullatum]